MVNPSHGGIRQSLAPAIYLVATPIGAARDITLRALDILASADVLAAEDSRTLRHLMEIHGIALDGRHIHACHQHNETEIAAKLVAAVQAGKSVAYASEAGTPLISDPGFPLTRAAIAAGVQVLAAPGPSAALAALAVSGLPTDRFFFAGFAPSAKGARSRFLAELKAIEATIILYESPRRINQILDELVQDWGKDRQAVIARELTKRFEEISRGSLGDLADAFRDREVKGEIVLLIDRPLPQASDVQTVAAALDQALLGLSVKDAAAEVAERFGLARRDVYQMALSRAKGG